MNMLATLVIVSVLSALFPVGKTANAAVFTVDRTVTLSSSQITGSSDGTNGGKRWRFGFPITPLTLNDGDTIRGTILFANSEGLRLADNGGGFFQIGPTTGLEQAQMEFRQTGPPFVTFNSFKLTFLAVNGPLLVNPISQSGGKFFSGTFSQLVRNMVNSGNSFLFQDFSYELTLNGGGPVNVQSIAIQFLAEDITIEVVNIEVPVDIKPQSCPNPLNLKSGGLLPVSILGTDDFDVTQVDPVTVRLELEDEVWPVRSALEDVATPFDSLTVNGDCSDCTDEGPDGLLDLTLKFDKQEVIEALGDVSDGDCLVLTLTGNLKDEFGGTPITGEDVVIILKKGKK